MADLAVWQRTIVDEEGNVIPGAEVEVRREEDGSLATLYADRAGETPLANPLAADMSGFVRFFIEGGAYTITAVGAGSTRTWRFDPTGRLKEFDRVSDALAVDDGADTAEARSLLGTFSTVADVQNSHIPPVLDSIRTNGYYSPGDGGGALLTEGVSSDAGAKQSLDGRWWKVAEKVVTPQMFGAKGDGTTDDTAAFQAMFDSGAKNVFIPQGLYVIDGHYPAQPGRRVLQWTVDDATLRCEGVLTSKSDNYGILEVFGDRNNIQLHVDGAGCAFSGVWVTGDSNIVSRCVIRNLHGKGYGAWGIRINTSKGGCLVSHNVIEGVTSDGTTAEEYPARCIALVVDQDAQRQSIIANNVLTDCLGPSAAAAHVIGTGSGPDARWSAKVLFSDNVITGFGRRGFKGQANDIIVRGNWFSSPDITEADTYAVGAIDIVNGRRVTVSQNTLTDCVHRQQINAQGETDPPYRLAEIMIEGNIIQGLDDNTLKDCIFVTRVDRCSVLRNSISCGGLSAISLGDVTDGALVVENTFYVADGPSNEDVVIVTAGAIDPVIRDNVFATGFRTAAVRVNAAGAVIEGNILTGFSGRLTRDTSSTPRRQFIFNNVAAEGQLIYSGGVENKLIGSNYGSNRAMGAIYVNSSLSELGSLDVLSGQIVYKKAVNSLPGYIGWIATEDGAADVVAWRLIGATSELSS